MSVLGTRFRCRRRWILACRRPGHPWEVAVITQGLLLWPYFTFARLIAPWVEPGKSQEFKAEWIPVIVAILVTSLLLNVAFLIHRSSPVRSRLNVLAILVGTWGMFGGYPGLTSIYAVVRE